MNNPNAPYRWEDDVYILDPQHFGIQGYADEKEMLDGLKTQAAIREAIERPRVHYGHYQNKKICRLNNSTAKWEALLIDPVWLGSAGGCPTCGRPFLHMPGYVPKADDPAPCQCGWVGIVKQLVLCVP